MNILSAVPAQLSAALGARTLGMSARNVAELIDVLRDGLPADRIPALARALGADVKEVLGVVSIPWATYSRRRARGRLTPLESERVMRIARVVEAVHGLFGPEDGNRWLRAPHRTLGGKTPLSYCASELGAARVLDLVNAAADGIFV